MVLKENWSSGDQLTAAQLNELTAAVKARYTKPGAGIPTSDLNAGQLEAKVKEVGDANYAPIGSVGSGISLADNGDGTATLTGSGVADNGDGTATITA